MARRRWNIRRVSRDTILFTVGLLGFGHEVIFGHTTERPTLLLVCAALMGLPVFLRSDERRSEGRSDPGDDR